MPALDRQHFARRWACLPASPSSARDPRAARRVDGQFLQLRVAHTTVGAVEPVAPGGSLPVFSRAHHAINILAAEQMPLAQRFATRDIDRCRRGPPARGRRRAGAERALRQCSSAPTAASTRGRPHHLRRRGGAVQQARRRHAADLPRHGATSPSCRSVDGRGLRPKFKGDAGTASGYKPTHTRHQTGRHLRDGHRRWRSVLQACPATVDVDGKLWARHREGLCASSRPTKVC